MAVQLIMITSLNVNEIVVLIVILNVFANMVVLVTMT